MRGALSLAALELLPRRVLVVAPQPEDFALGLGGLLAFHAERGDAVDVLVLASSAGGARAAAARRAAGALGIPAPRFLELGEGALDREAGLAARLAGEIDAADPEICYLPSPFESHPDPRATLTAGLAALSESPRRAACYAIREPLPLGALCDVTRQHEKKRAALAHFEQLPGLADLAAKAAAQDRGRTLVLEDAAVLYAEATCDPRDARLAALGGRLSDLAELRGAGQTAADAPAATAVISTWNKKDDLRENLESIAAQVERFAAVVVVDNASADGTAEMVAREYPEVRLIRMPHAAYGACETFNIGFASVTTPLTAILDDDIVLPPDWLAKARARLSREPAATAILSTKVVEPDMPASYARSAAVNTERYMSTFRGCGSLARTAALREAGFYDERLFIYGNERDLTCRLLNLGYRVLQYPGVETYHKTPFGMKMGKRSLYYHARNAWLTMLKYAPAKDLARMPWVVLDQVVLRKRSTEVEGGVADATGTIGLGRSLRQTPGAAWVLVKAALSVAANVPYCLARRRPVRHPDFDLPIR